MTDRLSVSDLGAVPETLLIPLAARAMAREAFPKLGFSDPAAEAIAARLDTDLSRFAVDRGSMHASLLRAIWFDDVARRFLKRYPQGLCVSLGAGLDTRASRIGIDAFPEAAWIDLDLPEVVKMRAALVPDTQAVKSAIGDATTPATWVEDLPWPPGRPLLMLIEGVLMYLPRDQVEALVSALCNAAGARGAPMQLALDYASPLMVRLSRQHPSVKKTRATFVSSLRRPHDLSAVDARLKPVAHRDVSSGAGAAGAVIGFTHRLLTGGRSIHGCAWFEFEALRGAPVRAGC